MNMIYVKPIRNESDYEQSLARLEQIFDAEAGTPEADEMEVLATLIEKFEAEHYPIDPPTPLDAIRFRMEQEGLEARDLEPILGSRSRVSEVLSGRRPLSIDMIRALNRHLGIPAESLIGEDFPAALPTSQQSLQIERTFRGWGLVQVGEGLTALIERALGGRQALALLRKSRTDRTNAKSDMDAILAWCAGALVMSEEVRDLRPFDRARMAEGIRTICRLSAEVDGISQVRSTLARFGVAFVVMPHLQKTYLDGAAMMRADGVPVVAMTLRRDHADAFWFTLAHELAHVWKHLSADRTAIIDDLDIGSSLAIEREADRLAQNSLIPWSVWSEFDTGEFFSKEQLLEIARKAGVGPAIVAGRWRMQNRNYKRFSNLLGHGTVRPSFPEWQALKNKMI